MGELESCIGFEEEIVPIDKRWRIQSPLINEPHEPVAVIPAFHGDGLLLMRESLVGRYVQEFFDAQFGKYSSCSPAHIKLRSWLFSRIHSCETDSDGAITVPTQLRDYAAGAKTKIACFERGRLDDVKMPTWVTGGLFGVCRSKAYSREKIRIPMRFRRLFSSSICATPSLTGDSTWVFQSERSCKDYVDGIFRDRFGGYDPSDHDQLASRTYLKCQIFDFEIPKDNTLSFAGTPLGSPPGTELVLVGVGDHIEVYPESVWRSAEAESQLLSWEGP